MFFGLFFVKKLHILLFPKMTYDIVFFHKKIVPECKPEWNREAITVFSRLPSLRRLQATPLLQTSLVFIKWRLRRHRLKNEWTLHTYIPQIDTYYVVFFNIDFIIFFYRKTNWFGKCGSKEAQGSRSQKDSQRLGRRLRRMFRKIRFHQKNRSS